MHWVPIKFVFLLRVLSVFLLMPFYNIISGFCRGSNKINILTCYKSSYNEDPLPTDTEGHRICLTQERCRLQNHHILHLRGAQVSGGFPCPASMSGTMWGQGVQPLRWGELCVALDNTSNNAARLQKELCPTPTLSWKENSYGSGWGRK